MRIAIHHEEVREGFVFKSTFHDVCVDVYFSHEERQVIALRNLGDQIVLERLAAGTRMDDNPDRHRTANPGEAKLYEAQLLVALHKLKAWLEANADPGERKVIEL